MKGMAEEKEQKKDIYVVAALDEVDLERALKDPDINPTVGECDGCAKGVVYSKEFFQLFTARSKSPVLMYCIQCLDVMAWAKRFGEKVGTA
ncbi:MAG: hypothetical protein ACE5MG_07520 [Candidatus Methylomirabilales bacterium]